MNRETQARPPRGFRIPPELPHDYSQRDKADKIDYINQPDIPLFELLEG